MRGKWAQGIEPRFFAWIVKGRLAVSERPGGYARTHRRVRRHEEILWLREHGFTRVVSLLASPHNLHAYEELGMPYTHVPFGAGEDPATQLYGLYPQIHDWLKTGERVLVHMEELGDRVQGVVAGFLLWDSYIDDAPRTINVIEQLLQRQMGPSGRQLVALAATLPKRA